MFALIIYGEECVCLHFTLQFYGGKARKQVPDRRVLLCFKPSRRNVPLAFCSLCLGFFCCFCLSLVATLAKGTGIFLRTVPQEKE